MKVVKIYGGLGNQMFQYAFARALMAVGRDEVRIDSSALSRGSQHNGFELERLFRLHVAQAPTEIVTRLSTQPTTMLSRFRRKYLTKPSHFIDKKFSYQPELMCLEGDRYLEGYWQTEKYFKGIELSIREEFNFKLPLSPRNRALLQNLKEPVASVHVRRGDYLSDKNLDVCTPAFYENAISALRETGTRNFLVFSDDITYSRSILAGLQSSDVSAYFVDWNRGLDSWQDMALMARCEQHVIANSSFSWWAAWLDPSENKRVLAPEVWNRLELDRRDSYYHFSFDDIVPESWERIHMS